jgi:hypothetical protein
VLEQHIGRIYRLGQTLPIDVYNLVRAANAHGYSASCADNSCAMRP